MNSDQLISLLSTLLKIIGTGVVAHGTLGINGAMWEQISGAVLMLAPVLFDMYRHTDTNKLASVAAMPGPEKAVAFAGIPDSAKIAAVTAMPDVEKIVVQPKATDGIGAALADPTQTKVVSQ
jgi:hypothetical protein